MAGIFNNYFANVDSSLAARIPHVNIPMCGNHLILHSTTPDEITLMITDIKDNAAGKDGIPACVIKAVGQAVSLPLSLLVNLSLSSGTFPYLLKQVVVSPIHNGKLKCDIVSFKPISVLVVISKIFERAMHTRLFTSLR